MISSLRLFFCVFLATVLAAHALPVAPNNCVASGFGNANGSPAATSIVITWTDRSTDETQWAIRYYIGTSATPNLINAISSTTRSQTGGTIGFLWTAGLANTSYRFTIQSYNGGYSTLSPGSSAITTSPFVLASVATPCESINLSWTNIVNESGYEVFLKGAPPTTDTRIALLGANVTTYSVTPPIIAPAKSYQFYVRPYINTTSSSTSTTTPTPTPTPIGSSGILATTFNGITSKPGLSGAPGSAFSHAFTQVSSSTVSSRTLVGTPPSLTFNATNGTLSGFHPPQGNYTLYYTVNFATGCSLNQTFHIRSRASSGAPLIGTTVPAWAAAVGATRDTALAGAFLDPEAESAYRVNTTVGNMDFILFDTGTTDTVTNFKNYVESGKYTDVAFHRCVPGVAIQSGKIKGTGTASNFSRVVADTPVPNEPGVSNTRGTLAMTKGSDTDPDSANSEFFINVANNSAAFDSSNGGTTVFGRVAGNGMTVADAIAALQRKTYSLTLDANPASTSFPDFPLTGTSSLPNLIDQARLVKINSINPIPTLNYSITGNTNPAVASAGIVNNTLRLTALTRGITNITVTATDLDGLSNQQIISVNLLDTYSSWTAQQMFPNGENGPNQDPDGDGWDNLNEFAFIGNPALPNTIGQVVFSGITGTTPSYLTLTFPVRKLTQKLSYQVEANDGLTGSWALLWKSSDGFAHPQVVAAVDQADRTIITVRDTATIGLSPQRFLRTRVVQD